ncbi:serine/threonine-protein kinase [Streptomyces sp. FZ201]|uniref:serine/threonine-protein kinase n=1 Tax=Streptomyces sp. FZ201 TaxID=3057122 RepID=UPI0021BFF1E2|nr:serine/threonine-protein kinase [Streptomyces sp. FZ201]
MNDGVSGRRVIDGRFELEARLGGGGMGMVWRARDLVLDRAVALKEVRPSDPGLAEYDPQAAATLRARVLREARALARVDHPNVVTIHHVVDGGDHAYPWIVMELVTGGSLQDRLEQGPLTPVEAARIGREVLAALRAAHDVGIQHRDVKPANVLLRPDGRPVLTDFGIAAIRESTVLTMTGSLIGTPDYMAPERISGGEGGPGSDLWSLAMMLYVAVEGHHPLRRGTTLATLAALLSEELPPPQRSGPLTPFLNAMLAKDPARRPDTETADRMLAAAAEATGPQAGHPATSYPLAPPPGPSAPVTPATPAGFGPPPTGFGPPAQTVTPGGWTPSPGTTTVQPTAPRPGGRGKRGLAVASSAAGVLLVGTLVWNFLPDDNGKADNSSAGSPGTSTPDARKSSSPTTSGSSPTSTAKPDASRSASADKIDTKNGLLTPDGIRMALAAIEEETGRNRAGDLTIYPDYVNVQLMVEGSDTKYDSYTYRLGRGVEKGIISSTIFSGNRPFTFDDFDWDVVPALLKRAEKELNVDKPTSRYVLVRAASETFDTPLGLAVYLGDEYATGYLDADLKGNVTRVMPAED